MGQIDELIGTLRPRASADQILQYIVSLEDDVDKLQRMADKEPPLEVAGYSEFMSMAEIEELHICRAMERHKNNKTKAARDLGINIKTLYNKWKILQDMSKPYQSEVSLASLEESTTCGDGDGPSSSVEFSSALQPKVQESLGENRKDVPEDELKLVAESDSPSEKLPSDEEQEAKICFCGNPITSNHPAARYCSRECKFKKSSAKAEVWG